MTSSKTVTNAQLDRVKTTYIHHVTEQTKVDRKDLQKRKDECIKSDKEQLHQKHVAFKDINSKGFTSDDII